MLASGLLLAALLACLTLMVLVSIWRQKKLWGKLPPGPTPLPFIGNYLQLNTEQMYDSLMKVPPGLSWLHAGWCREAALSALKLGMARQDQALRTRWGDPQGPS